MNGCDVKIEAERVPAFAAGWALFLDVDGTLLDIAGHPDAVTVSPRLHEVLRIAYQLSDGAVALISGRSLADLDRLFGPPLYPAAGQHGLERRDSAGHVTSSIGAMERLGAVAYNLASQARMRQGIVVEHKGLSLALHFRTAPQMHEWAELTMHGFLHELGPGFQLIEGKMVLELKPVGRDKGTAIADFMAEPPFASRLPVFIGDDVTDEDGFAVVNMAGGHAIKVGGGDSLARWRMADAQSVRRWLEAYTSYLETGAAR